MGNTRRYLGIALVLIGVLLFTNIIPVGSTPQSVCVQSVVKLVTVCSVPSSYVDSIAYNGVIIAPSLGNNPIYVTQPQGTLQAYYFLAQGATLVSKSASYCSGTGCSPNQPLTVSLGNTAASVPYISAQTPSMQTGLLYKYQFSITDSLGTTSTLSDGVIVQSATATYTAKVSTVNGTYILAGTGAVVAFNVYANENAYFTVTQMNNAAVTGISLNIQPQNTIVQLSQTSFLSWAGYVNFAPGTYTVTATDNTGTTVFSVRVSSFVQKIPTLSSITNTSPTLTLTTTTSGTATSYLCGANACTTVVSSSGSSTTFVTTQTSTSVGSVAGTLGFGLGQVSGFLLMIVGGIFAFRRGKR